MKVFLSPAVFHPLTHLCLIQEILKSKKFGNYMICYFRRNRKASLKFPTTYPPPSQIIFPLTAAAQQNSSDSKVITTKCTPGPIGQALGYADYSPGEQRSEVPQPDGTYVAASGVKVFYCRTEDSRLTMLVLFFFTAQKLIILLL